MSTKAPSLQAIKAAQAISAKYEAARNFGRNASPYHDDLAAIIDAEFPAYEEMREALERINHLVNHESKEVLKKAGNQ